MTGLVGIEGFVAGLAAQEIGVERRGGLLVYKLVPISGAAAGSEVETGVAAADLTTWPSAPPHWVHAPNTVPLPGGGQQPSELDGWARYSRPHPGRIDAAAAPARVWVAHVRALLGTAA
jgi:hypothetical protein